MGLNYKMTSKLLIDDGNYDEWCEEDILKCYRDAAEYDDVLFGNYDLFDFINNNKFIK